MGSRIGSMLANMRPIWSRAILLSGVLCLLCPGAICAQQSTALAGAGGGFFPPGSTYNGVSISGLRFGMGVDFAGDGSVVGTFEFTLLGTTAGGSPQIITIEGKATGGTLLPAGGASVLGVTSVDMGDGTGPVTSLPLTLEVTTDTVGQGTLALIVDATSIPAAAVDKGALTLSECVPVGPGVLDTICDGHDDDCDGLVDEDFVPVATTCGTGTCVATGMTACVGGVVVDSCTPPASGSVAVEFSSSMLFQANVSGPPEDRVLIQFGTTMNYRANSSEPGIGVAWTAEIFDDSSWSGGLSGAPYGVGYDTGVVPNAASLIQTSVPPGTLSVYTRARFTIADASQVRGLYLGADFDDGYVAWVNGVEVSRASMPAGSPDWNTNATLHESSNGTTPNYGTLVDISAAALPVLHDGDNVLAIGVWNSGGSTSTDLVLVPKLAAVLDWTTEGYSDASWPTGRYGVGYDTGAAPNASGLILTTVPNGAFSVYTRAPFDLTSTDLAGIISIFLGADFDDAYVAYLNGVEVVRASTMPAGDPVWNTNAALHESSNGTTPNYGTLVDISTAIPLLHAGTNVLAVGVWNSAALTSTDLVLVPRLSFNEGCGP